MILKTLLLFFYLIITTFADDGESFFGSNVEKDSCTGENCDTSNTQNNDLNEINVIITFTNGVGNVNLQNKFRLTVNSMLKYASIPLAIHIIGEQESQTLASEIIKKENVKNRRVRLVNLDINKLVEQLQDVVKVMRSFSTQSGSYYNQALFFLSIGIHRILYTDKFTRVIMLDADLKFQSDIAELYKRFDTFSDNNIIGIGRELQPVYRHTFSTYRSHNPGTRVGDPGPDGLTGFNSGVLLLDLRKMANSKLYNSYLNEKAVSDLAKEFMFKGHLGDQDFFTLLSMRHEELFHTLPCSWNRQLCVWWRSHGYEDMFDRYYDCPNHIHILHGNCNTPIP